MNLAAVAPRSDFSPESVAEWSTDSDLLAFLLDLYDDAYVMTMANGEKVEGTYRDYGGDLFARGRTRFLAYAAEFSQIATDNRAEPLPDDQPIRIENVPDFAGDPGFGLMAKYIVAWDGVVEWVLSDNWFFSLPLTLEARSEIDCSILLASRLYYKQALQVLRGALELSVLHLHFAANDADYSRWREGSFKVPPFRGKDGLLARLVERATLSPELAKEAGDLYGDLNGTIQGHEYQ